MDLYITRPTLSGIVTVRVKDKNNNLIYEKENIELEDVIEFDENNSEELNLEITYMSKLLINRKERFKYCLDNLIMIIKCMSIKVK